MDVLQLATAGESHGPGIVAILSGMPSGLTVSPEEINLFLARRRDAPGRSSRMQEERDECQMLSGVRNGVTTGSPISLLVPNRSQGKWGAEPGLYPRPGHADWTGVLRHGLTDIRDVWERASGRSTVAPTCAGAVAVTMLREFGIMVFSWAEAIGGISARVPDDPLLAARMAGESAMACPDPEAGQLMLKAIEQARATGTTLGGVLRVGAVGVAPGLGDYTDFGKRLDARMAGWLIAIPGVKAVEIGEGIAQSGMAGRDAHDGFAVKNGKVGRTGNLAGGVEGGMTNGQPILVRCFVKPVPTQEKPLPSFNIRTLEPGPALVERGDTCAVHAVAVVAECVLGLVLADAILARFGSDSVAGVTARYRQYISSIPWEAPAFD